ncbi:AtpZ/AtpI family protein [Candidatus Microgenomates bacterium]|nr:AtpZ/AtpI family protein [Candidatus Microgenomates bacterium]
MRKIMADYSFGELEFVKRPQKRKPNEDFRNVDPNAMNAGMYILVPILLGLAIGYGADLYFHTKPLWLILSLLAGTACSFYNLFKLIPRNEDPKK